MPSVSVVIPTAGRRPRLLRRAVDSALAGQEAGAVEVIVVPNGPAADWRDAIAALPVSPGLVISPIESANVSAARNHGLAVARGELVRFLDDDDFLCPDAAARQYRELLAAPADLSSCAVRIEDERGQVFATLAQPAIDDVVAAQLGVDRLPLPLAHVYRRAVLDGIRWNEDYHVAEDIAWLLTVLTRRELRWIRSEDVVGVWYQHGGPRLTYPHAAHEPNRVTAASLQDAVAALDARGVLDKGRTAAAAAGLWTCVHRAFYLRPWFWHRVAQRALALDRDVRPTSILFRRPAWRRHPLLLEWLAFPGRLALYLATRLRGRLLGWNHVRHL